MTKNITWNLVGWPRLRVRHYLTDFSINGVTVQAQDLITAVQNLVPERWWPGSIALKAQPALGSNPHGIYWEISVDVPKGGYTQHPQFAGCWDIKKRDEVEARAEETGYKIVSYRN